MAIVQMKRLRDPSALAAHLADLQIDIPFAPSDTVAALLGSPATVGAQRLANRFAVLPMEGWDGTTDGRPTDLVRRRWRRFGASGAALIWGGEAVAVRADGRANPRQLCIGPNSEHDLSRLRDELLAEHPGPLPMIGLQLTHSGRWSRPHGEPAPRTAFEHPQLDGRVGATGASVFTDSELDDLVGDYVRAAQIAHAAGFDFVDVKHCHGYLLHELLAAFDRPGAYGGSLENRMHFLDQVVAGIRRDAPELAVGVRLSAFDVAPFGTGDDGRGVPLAADGPRRFGGDATPTGIDLAEPHAFCAHLRDLGIALLCVTAGSPYTCPHVQRPAFFPPSDGYLPPRDPLYEVAQLLAVTREIARAHPELVVVASGLSYLQEWLPAAAAALVADGVTCVGYGRGVLSYPELPLAVIAGTEPERSRLCRTFSDCTTAPRHGLVSGCFPLDEYYKHHPDRAELTRVKRAAERARGGRRTR